MKVENNKELKDYEKENIEDHLKYRFNSDSGCGNRPDILVGAVGGGGPLILSGRISSKKMPETQKNTVWKI